MYNVTESHFTYYGFQVPWLWYIFVCVVSQAWFPFSHTSYVNVT